MTLESWWLHLQELNRHQGAKKLQSLSHIDPTRLLFEHPFSLIHLFHAVASVSNKLPARNGGWRFGPPPLSLAVVCITLSSAKFCLLLREGSYFHVLQTGNLVWSFKVLYASKEGLYFIEN